MTKRKIEDQARAWISDGWMEFRCINADSSDQILKRKEFNDVYKIIIFTHSHYSSRDLRSEI